MLFRSRLRKTVYGLKQSPAAYYKLCREVYTKVGMTQLKSDECIFVRYENNIIGNPPLNIEDLLESGYFRTMPIVPEHQRLCRRKLGRRYSFTQEYLLLLVVLQ